MGNNDGLRHVGLWLAAAGVTSAQASTAAANSAAPTAPVSFPPAAALSLPAAAPAADAMAQQRPGQANLSGAPPSITVELLL